MAASRPGPLLYLWDKRTLYLGRLRSPVRLSLAASRLIVSLGDEMRVTCPRMDREIVCRSLLLPVGLKVRVDTGRSPIADCHLDVAGFDHAVLRQLARRGINDLYYDLKTEPEMMVAFSRLYDEQSLPEVAYRQLDRLLNPPALAANTHFAVDPRVLETIRLIKCSTRENVSVEYLAAQVELSASRLVCLFKSQVGIPIRRYRLWHRLYRSTVLLANGASLTEAALEAGFSDSAHFSNTYRKILDIKPSALFNQGSSLRVFAEPFDTGTNVHHS